MAFQRKSQPLKSWSRLSSAIWKSSAAYGASVKKIKRFTRVACVLMDSFRLLTGCTWRLALESPPESFSRNGLGLAIRNIIIKLVLCLPVVPSVFFPWKLKFLFIKVINISVNKTRLLITVFIRDCPGLFWHSQTHALHGGKPCIFVDFFHFCQIIWNWICSENSVN